MRWLGLVAATAALLAAPALAQDGDGPMANGDWSLVIHGGAGVIERENITPAKDAEIRAALNAALDRGSRMLANGASAEEAIIATIMVLEDDANFNAGHGAVLSWEGKHELDASIMTGHDRAAGAVAGSHHTKNPILLAQAVKDKSVHVMLSGEGADAFSREQGLAQVEQSYYTTDYRARQLERMKAKAAENPAISALDVEFKYGTVGAVARDMNGHLAAGTSTGGMTGKRWGRIGDSPIIGAGTWADDARCAVSATGWGEYFIRVGVAHEICSRMKARWRVEIEKAQAEVPKDADGNPTYAIHASEFGLSAEQGREEADAVMAEVKELGGDGGVIVVSPWGEAAWSFNTAGMYRGVAKSDSTRNVAIYGDEE